jgi:hypothetical protein
MFATSSIARANVTDDYVRTEMIKRKIPGLSIAVIRNGETVRRKTGEFVQSDGDDNRL